MAGLADLAGLAGLVLIVSAVIQYRLDGRNCRKSSSEVFWTRLAPLKLAEACPWILQLSTSCIRERLLQPGYLTVPAKVRDAAWPLPDGEINSQFESRVKNPENNGIKPRPQTQGTQMCEWLEPLKLARNLSDTTANDKMLTMARSPVRHRAAR